jgi:coenzyme F420-reducing hydrogenase gamma subunit
MTIDVDCAVPGCRPARASMGDSDPAMLASAYAPRTSPETVIPIWQAAM